MRRALADQAQVEQGYSQVVSPIDGKVNVWAARQGEVVTAGEPIVTIMDLSQTWVYAPLPETQADSVQLGDSCASSCPAATPSRARSSPKPPKATSPRSAT